MSKLFSLFASDRKKFNNWIEKAEEYRKSENFHDSLLCFDRALEVAEKNNDIDTSEYEIVYLYRAWLNCCIICYVSTCATRSERLGTFYVLLLMLMILASLCCCLLPSCVL